MTNMPAGKEPKPGAFAVAVSQEVRMALARRRMSGSKLATLIERSQSYMSKRLRGEASFTANDIEAIAKVLGEDLLTMLTAAIRNARRHQ